MPLVGYHLIGFDQEPFSFTLTDHKLLQRPEHRDRVAAFFSRTPHRFNLIFHNAKWKNPHRVARPDIAWMMHGRLGGVTRTVTRHTRSEDNINYFLSNRGRLLNHDAINIIYTNNATGTPIIPLTPHMMTHRLGHLHLLMQENGKLFNLLIQMADQLLFIGYDYTLGHSPNFYCPWSGPCDTQTLWMNAILKAIVTTRAGRERQIHGWEYLPEMMAQYINRGHVRMPEQVPDILRLREIFHRDAALKVPCPKGELFRNHSGAPFTLSQYGQEIDEFFDTILGSWHGQIIVT